jgi:hypothetical protein
LRARRRPATLAPTNRDGRPLFLLLALGVGLVVTLALMGVDRWLVKPRPAAPDVLDEVRPPCCTTSSQDGAAVT